MGRSSCSLGLLGLSFFPFSFLCIRYDLNNQKNQTFEVLDDCFEFEPKIKLRRGRGLGFLFLRDSMTWVDMIRKWEMNHDDFGQ